MKFRKSKKHRKNAVATIKLRDNIVKMPLYEKLYGRLIVCAPVVSWHQFSSHMGHATGMPQGPSRLQPKPNSRKNQTKSPPSTTPYALPVPWCEPLQASVICSLIVVDLEYYVLVSHSQPPWPWYSSKHRLQIQNSNTCLFHTVKSWSYIFPRDIQNIISRKKV